MRTGFIDVAETNIEKKNGKVEKSGDEAGMIIVIITPNVRSISFQTAYDLEKIKTKLQKLNVHTWCACAV